MKTLTLIRHAKSDWDDHALSDHARPLNKRGKKAAPKVGAELARNGAKPDLILSSTARRAHDTAIAIAAEVDYSADSIVTEHALYHPAPETMRQVIAATDEEADIKHLMLVSHWPGVKEFTYDLTHTDAIDRFITCAVAIIELDITYWGEIGDGCGTLLRFFTPHDLKA